MLVSEVVIHFLLKPANVLVLFGEANRLFQTNTQLLGSKDTMGRVWLPRPQNPTRRTLLNHPDSTFPSNLGQRGTVLSGSLDPAVVITTLEPGKTESLQLNTLSCKNKLQSLTFQGLSPSTSSLPSEPAGCTDSSSGVFPTAARHCLQWWRVALPPLPCSLSPQLTRPSSGVNWHCRAFHKLLIHLTNPPQF